MEACISKPVTTDKIKEQLYDLTYLWNLKISNSQKQRRENGEMLPKGTNFNL